MLTVALAYRERTEENELVLQYNKIYQKIINTPTKGSIT